ncbi:MAG: hypothetical protein QM579_02240 [Desulfovibrio sp.]|uniref:hypothetical protein n=1 Tax=Desulfovibrio sp. TaxID=885 RepID=UPI0039E497D8
MTSDTFGTGFSQESPAHNVTPASTTTGAISYLGTSGGYGNWANSGGSPTRDGSNGATSRGTTGVQGTVDVQGDASTSATSDQNTGQDAEQGTGQELLHRQIEQHMRQQEAARHTQWQKQISQWREEVAQDPQLGGTHMAANVARAQLALDRFDQGRHIGRLLEESGYGNHPEVLRFFNRVADALMEDSLVRGEPGSSMPPLEERMYAGWSSRK